MRVSIHGFRPGIFSICLPLLLALSSALLSSAVSPDVPVDWWSRVHQQIADSEYEVSWQVETSLPDLVSSWQAPNRAHAFRTHFTADGIRVVPRSAGAADAPPGDAVVSWEWSLRLARWGRAGSTQEPPAARLQIAGNRVEYDRGELVESYVNDRRGLKHGFAIARAPEANGEVDESGGPVHLDLALGGTLSPAVAADGQAIDFATPRGVNVLHYAELRVEDARGRVLRSWMEGFSEPGLRGIRIVYEDAGAAYPVTVDPLATSPAWTAESDQGTAEFGFSVATAGDVNGDGYSDVIVGAHFYDNGDSEEGRAYVYHGSAAGLLPNPAWTAEGNQASAEFGISGATAGDVNGDGYSDVIVGASRYGNGQLEEGRAFVYHGSATGLSPSPAWTAESDQAGAHFGFDVATAGDVNGDGRSDVVVGARFYSNGQAGEGRAFVYHGSAAGLSSSPWTAESNQAGAGFGVSVATAGDVDGDGHADVIVGANGYANGQTNEGRAFVYHGSAAGLSAGPAWTAESNQLNANFGASVATAGDVNGDGRADVIVGANGYTNDQAGEGRAFVYLGSAAGLEPSHAWTAEGNQANPAFAREVAAAGDVNGDGYADVVVGAPFFSNGDSLEGRAFAYLGSASGLATSHAWTAEGNQLNANFGVSVATAGDVNGDGFADVIVGANLYTNGQSEEGRAFVYHGSPAGLAASPGWTAESDQGAAEFGASAATAGDVNGDGYADVIVGAYRYDSGQAEEGRAFAYHGSAAGLETSAAWTAESNQAGASFGTSVGTAGDVNGDGYADVVIGASGYSNGQSGEGRAFVHHGSATGLAPSPAWTAESDQASAFFGVEVAAAGDVNGDGYADVIVGARSYDNGQTNEGRAFAYHGAAGGLATSPAWTAEADQASSNFGDAVSTAGDVNGDGYADVVVGAWGFDNGSTDEGRAFVYHGSGAGLSPSPAWTAESDQASAFFGYALGTAGDVNGDGYADLIVGAWSFDSGATNEGTAFVYHGSPAGLAPSPAWTAESDQASAFFGISVATAGDVNGDGFADVVIGAHGYDNGESSEGRAWVYHGSTTGLASSPGWTAESDQAGAVFGTSVRTAGDVNADGYADVVVGASSYDNGAADEGRAFLYHGNGGAGLSLIPRQRRVTDAGPIAHLGTSDSPGGFRLNLLGRTPFGRGRVVLEREVRPLGAALNGLASAVGVHAYDTGTSGVELSEQETGLFDLSPYHWRVRLRYDPVTTPFIQRSRWLTMPWGGWQEMMLRTADPSAAGRLEGLVLDKATGVQITLAWDASCLATDTEYAIYEGTLGDFTSHDSRYCDTGGATTRTFTPLAGDTYYIVVPRNATREGSYGTDSQGIERPQGVTACQPQQLAACP